MKLPRSIFSLTLTLGLAVLPTLVLVTGCGGEKPAGVMTPPEEDPTLTGEDSTMQVK